MGEDVLERALAARLTHRLGERDRVELPPPALPFEEEAPEDIVGEERAELDGVPTLEAPQAREDPVALEDVQVEVGSLVGRQAGSEPLESRERR